MTSQKRKNLNDNSNFKKVKFATSINLNNHKSLYKRHLPETCITLHSEQGIKIFQEALEEKNLECYFMLSPHLVTQSELTYCGISSLCMILNALEVDPLYNWKAWWRFYTDYNIRCPPHINRNVIDMQGITLDQFSDLAQYNYLEEVKLCRANTITKDEFIKDIEHVCQQRREVMTLNFSRDVIKQTGLGHICPLGGFNKKRGMVLLLDVARHKYPLYWVSVDLLWDSINTVDRETGITRGYSIVRNPLQLMKNALILYYNFKESLENLFNYIILNLQDNLINNENEINNVFSLLRPTLIEIMNKINSIKSKLTNLERSIFIATYLADNSTNPLRKDYLDTINEFYKEIKSTILYKNIVNIKNEISIDFDDSKEDNSEYPVLNNELLYFGILIIYVILPTLHEIMKNWQKKQLINISSLINELEETYLEDIKINRVINSESNFFLNSFFQIDENNEKRQKL